MSSPQLAAFWRDDGKGIVQDAALGVAQRSQQTQGQAKQARMQAKQGNHQPCPTHCTLFSAAVWPHALCDF
jgi:hypothetical protein